MEALLEIGETFAIGAVAGVIFAVWVKANQLKNKKEKEKKLKD